MEKNKNFATCLCCIDGRIQLPLNNWIKDNYDIDFVDIITEPGIDNLISSNNNIDNLIDKLKLSINNRGSGLVFVAGHHDCLANPISDENHKNQIIKSVEIINSIVPTCKVIGLWVSKDSEVEKQI